MILLFLTWPQTRCTEDFDTKGEEILDQIATASENVAYTVRYSNATSKNLAEPLPSVPSSINTTLHYENSNGFVPIIPTNALLYGKPDYSSQQIDNLDKEDDQSEDSNTTNVVSARDNSTRDPKNFEEDLTYSSEARIFLNLSRPLTNRRNFDLQERPNEFELLKVNNDTPAVANYQDFYENLDSTVNTETDNEPEASSPGRVNGERGKRIENYAHSYNRQSQETRNKDPYIQYYTYNDAHDTKKLTTYEPEKVPGNYRQQDTTNYDGHGQSVVIQNVATVSSSRTNYEANELTHGGSSPGGTYNNAAGSARARQKFSRPVVVADPSNYKVETKFNGQLLNGETDNDYKTSRNLESSSSETSSHYDTYNDNKHRSYHRPEDSRNFSDESSDYSEYIERPRKVQKSRRRPPYSDSYRKLPKEHRSTLANNAEEQGKPHSHSHSYSSARLKSQRHRVKANPWINDDSINLHDESVEDVVRVSGTETKSTKVQHGTRPKNVNTWNQISPSVEITHSKGIELDQVEKPKYILPVNVNFVPVANFDHASALDNSQGFDVSNALLQNMMTASPIGAYTTSTPILSTPSSILGQNLAISKNVVNAANLGVSTSVPDIIVGQNSFQNPMHAVVLSPSNGQNKVANTVRATYLPSTIAPMFALTPTLQNVRFQNVQGNVTPRTAISVTPTPTTVVQHVPINQVHNGMQQLIVPQPTVQTFSGFIQAPVQANTEYQIQVNPHGLQGQNLVNHNLHMHSVPTTPTLSSNQGIPESRINMLSGTQSKKYATSDGNLLATASVTVGQNEQKQASNINSYYLHHDTQQVAKPQEEVYQVVKNAGMTPKTKTYLQATQIVPTVLQPNPTLGSTAVNTHQYVKLHSNGADDAVQMQLNREHLLKNNRWPGFTLQTADNAVSHSNSVNAHLPNMGTKNVEIVNPNIKPSSIDTTINTFSTMHHPATILTTPIPIFSTIAPVTPQTISLQSYVDSLTETGTNKARQFGTIDLKASQNQERPMYNPINFVPNVDIIKNQHVLNSKAPPNEAVQQSLNLVPVMPGGNFFKPSIMAQNELVLKPKLASDLQQYAEEMFKESLKTMYNSQKWNNDRNPPGTSQNKSEANDLEKLRLELQKLKASLSESKYKDLLEAQSENRVRAIDAPKFLNDKKKPDALLATLEHLLKSRPSGPIHIWHGSSKPSRRPKPSGDSSVGFQDEFHGDNHVREFLTPPRHNHLRTKTVFHEKPIKIKRPGTVRYKNGPRKSGRGRSPRPNGLDSSASSINVHLDGSYNHRLPFDVDNADFEPRHQPSFDNYPSFTASPPDTFKNILRELRSNNKDYDINHPRMHNLLGLLMKNKQLPSRDTQNRFRDKNQMRQFFDTDRLQVQQQFYDEALKDYMLNKFDGASESSSILNRKIYSRNGAA